MNKDSIPSPDTLKQFMSVDADVRATPRLVAPEKLSKNRFHDQPGRAERRAKRGTGRRERLRGVALAEKPWQLKQVYEQSDDGTVTSSI